MTVPCFPATVLSIVWVKTTGRGMVIGGITGLIKTEKDAAAEWQKVRDIDNPLNPWVSFYRDEFPHLHGQDRPTYQQLATVFRKAKLIAIVGSIAGIILFVLLIPGIMISFDILNAEQFTAWVMTMHVWCFVTAAVIIVVTPFEEFRTICRELKRKRM
ncbi:hypothetical protein ACOMHN_064106 [Nucella lapillus]